MQLPQPATATPGDEASPAPSCDRGVAATSTAVALFNRIVPAERRRRKFGCGVHGDSVPKHRAHVNCRFEKRLPNLPPPALIGGAEHSRQFRVLRQNRRAGRGANGNFADCRPARHHAARHLINVGVILPVGVRDAPEVERRESFRAFVVACAPVGEGVV